MEAVAIVVLILKTIYIANRNKSDFLSLTNYTPSGIHGKMLVCAMLLLFVTGDMSFVGWNILIKIE